MTADPPPNMMDDNVPVIDVKMFKFCLTINQMESITSSNVPIFVLIKLIMPCCATVNNSTRGNKIGKLAAGIYIENPSPSLTSILYQIAQ